jgi:hypothetical protein
MLVGQLLDVRVFVRGKGDLADGVGAVVVEDVVLDVAGALVRGEAQIQFDRVGYLVDRIAGGQFDGVVILRLHGLIEIDGDVAVTFFVIRMEIFGAENARANHEKPARRLAKATG